MGDPQALAAAIVQLLRDRALWGRFAQVGPRTRAQRLSWEGMGEAVADAYAAAVNRANTR